MDTEEAYASKGYMSIHEADVEEGREEGRKEEREKIAAEMAAKDAEIQRLSELLASKG